MASSRPSPITDDLEETTPVVLHQRKNTMSLAMIDAESYHGPPNYAEEEKKASQPQAAFDQQERASRQAESNLLNAINFHRKTSQQAIPIQQNEFLGAYMPELRQMTNVNPTVSDSEACSVNAQLIAESNDGDTHLSGEQRYETDGEQDVSGPSETLTERQLAQPTLLNGGVRTPQHQQTQAEDQIMSSTHINLTEMDVVPNEQENSNFIADDNNQGLENEIRSLSHYSLQQRRQMNNVFKSFSSQQTTTINNYYREQPSEGSISSKRPQVPPQDDDNRTMRQAQSFQLTPSNFALKNVNTIDDAAIQGRQLQLEEMDGDNTVRHTFYGQISRDQSQNQDDKKITLHQVLNFDFKKRTSVHVNRELSLKLDPIRSRSFVKTSRAPIVPTKEEEDGDQDDADTPIRRVPSTMLPSMTARVKKEQTMGDTVFSNTLTSFLKVKATKAYKFGEGLVKSITQDNRMKAQSTRTSPSVIEVDPTEQEMPDKKNSERVTAKNISHFKAKMTMQAKAKTNDDQMYTPPQRRTETSHHGENFDTQVMNIEADFEQLDIGEEPIFERNIVKMRSMNIFKDKMSILQVNQAQAQQSMTQRQIILQQPRARSSIPTNDRNMTRNTLAEPSENPTPQQLFDFPPLNDPTPQQDDTLSSSQINRYSNTVDFSSSIQQFVPFHKRVDRQTFGINPDTQFEEEKKEVVPAGKDIQTQVQHRKSLTNQNLATEECGKDGIIGPTLPSRPGQTRLDLMNNRRRSNKSTYVESSLFGNAIESLFGKDSIFGALDQPLQEDKMTPKNLKDDAAANQNSRLSRSLDRRNYSQSVAGGGVDASHFKTFRQSLLPPPLPESDPKHRKYTLVLDLDETLVHFEHRKAVYKVRPLCLKFLNDMAQLYEIVIFTAAHQTYANFILDKLDTEKSMISHRLYRQHTSQIKGAFIKDLSRLGRPLERTLIIDNLKENFQRQKELGIECGTWKGNIHDRQLNTLGVFLTKMANDKPEDVREHIARFKATFNPFANE